MSMRRWATWEPGSPRALRDDETGKGTIRTLIALAIISAVVYAGVKFIPARAAAYQFDDAVRDEVTFAASRRSTDEAIRRNLMEAAQMLELPIQGSDIKITRPGAKWIKIDVAYTIELELIGGYTFEWPFSPSHEGPLIY